jgi:hypothetical protein
MVNESEEQKLEKMKSWAIGQRLIDMKRKMADVMLYCEGDPEDFFMTHMDFVHDFFKKPMYP